jgi:hypothetical protein
MVAVAAFLPYLQLRVWGASVPAMRTNVHRLH